MAVYYILLYIILFICSIVLYTVYLTILWSERPRSPCSIAGGENVFPLLQSVETSSGAQPATYSKGFGAISPISERPGLEVDLASSTDISESSYNQDVRKRRGCSVDCIFC